MKHKTSVSICPYTLILPCTSCTLFFPCHVRLIILHHHIWAFLFFYFMTLRTSNFGIHLTLLSFLSQPFHPRSLQRSYSLPPYACFLLVHDIISSSWFMTWDSFFTFQYGYILSTSTTINYSFWQSVQEGRGNDQCDEWKSKYERESLDFSLMWNLDCTAFSLYSSNLMYLPIIDVK
jgi:hypothetical protein